MSDREQPRAIVTIAMVSTNQLLRLGLQAVVATHQHLRLIGEATSELEAEELVARERPHLLIIQMEPEIAVMELVRKVKTSTPTIRIIALSEIGDKHCASGAFSSGIDAIVLNIQPTVVLLATIDYVCQLRTETLLYDDSEPSHPVGSGTTANSDSARPISPKCPDTSLTEREQEIIALVGQALSNKDIAERLCISSITVRHHLTSIFGKFDVNSRQKLLLRAHEYGLLKLSAYQ